HSFWIFPYTTLFRSRFVYRNMGAGRQAQGHGRVRILDLGEAGRVGKVFVAVVAPRRYPPGGGIRLQREFGQFVDDVDVPVSALRSEEHTSELQSREK